MAPSKVGVFWDYCADGCYIPEDLPTTDAISRVRTFASSYGAVTIFKIYLGAFPEHVSAETRAFISDLQSCGLSASHSASDRSGLGTMLTDMFSFSMENGVPSTIVVITGDSFFSYGISQLHLRNYKVIVVNPDDKSDSFPCQAFTKGAWHKDVMSPAVTTQGPRIVPSTPTSTTSFRSVSVARTLNLSQTQGTSGHMFARSDLGPLNGLCSPTRAKSRTSSEFSIVAPATPTRRNQDRRVNLEPESARMDMAEQNEHVRAQLSDITNLLSELWTDFKQYRQTSGLKSNEGMSARVGTDPESYERGQESHGPTITQVLEELRTQSEAQKELIISFSDAWRNDSARQFEDLVRAMKETAQEMVPFNVTGYLDEFSKALSGEVRVLLGEVGRLHELKRTLQFQTARLMELQAKFGPGGEFEADWQPNTFPDSGPRPRPQPPRPPESPPPPPGPEDYQPPPMAESSWRTVSIPSLASTLAPEPDRFDLCGSPPVQVRNAPSGTQPSGEEAFGTAEEPTSKPVGARAGCSQAPPPDEFPEPRPHFSNLNEPANASGSNNLLKQPALMENLYGFPTRPPGLEQHQVPSSGKAITRPSQQIFVNGVLAQNVARIPVPVRWQPPIQRPLVFPSQPPPPRIPSPPSPIVSPAPSNHSIIVYTPPSFLPGSQPIPAPTPPVAPVPTILVPPLLVAPICPPSPTLILPPPPPASQPIIIQPPAPIVQPTIIPPPPPVILAPPPPPPPPQAGKFAAIIRALEHSYDGGGDGKVGHEDVKRDFETYFSNAYQSVGATNFEEYVELASQANILVLGGSGASKWIRLNPQFHHLLTALELFLRRGVTPVKRTVLKDSLEKMAATFYMSANANRYQHYLQLAAEAKLVKLNKELVELRGL